MISYIKPIIMKLFNFQKQKSKKTEPVFSSFTDKRDGSIYRTVQIDNQIWMAENLAYIPYITDVKQQGGIWVYNYDGQNSDIAKNTTEYQTYGCLYDLKTALKVIPEGWHLPSKDEWKNLIMLFGEQAGLKCKSTNGWIGQTGNGTDLYGFSFLPGGSRGDYGHFHNIGKKGTWWTSTDLEEGYTKIYGGTSYLVIGLSYDDDDFITNISGDINCGYSVRCVKD